MKGRVPSNHALAVYIMVNIPVLSMCGMFHGSFTLPLPTSLLTGAVFVGMKCVLHIWHLYPTPARQPNEAQRHQEAEVVIASSIWMFVAWHLGLFVAYTLDASRRRLLEQQMLLRAPTRVHQQVSPCTLALICRRFGLVSVRQESVPPPVCLP